MFWQFSVELKQICKEYHERITKLENIKYDLEYEVRQKDFVVSDLPPMTDDYRQMRSNVKSRHRHSCDLAFD